MILDYNLQFMDLSIDDWNDDRTDNKETYYWIVE